MGGVVCSLPSHAFLFLSGRWRAASRLLWARLLACYTIIVIPSRQNVNRCWLGNSRSGFSRFLSAFLGRNCAAQCNKTRKRGHNIFSSHFPR
jgi:hypothetical protein